MSEQTAIVVQNESRFLSPAATIQEALARYALMGQFTREVLKSTVDYGPIPGTGTKPTLLKPGAEKLNSLFGLAPKFEILDKDLDWTGERHGGEPFFYFQYVCELYSNGRLIATGIGSCNSWEKKYRYRQADRTCPNCGKATIFKSKNKPEFFCWAKRGGCGATFPLTDERITKQETGQVKNPDPAEQVNTLDKMAQKRALIAATLIATNASEYFTQDLEDFPGMVVEGTYTDAPEQPSGNGHNPTPPEPEPIPVEQDTAVLPIVSLEMANAMTTSEGVAYGAMSLATIKAVKRGIEKALTAPDLTQERREELQLKLACAKVVIDAAPK